MRSDKKIVRAIGVDVGGTFTDLVVLLQSGEIQTAKVVSTTHNQSIGVMNGLAALKIDLSEVSDLIHGTTVGTNAILERKGSKTAFLTTVGFKDMLEFQRQDRSNIWDLGSCKVEPLVPRSLSFEVRERISSKGTILQELDRKGLHLLKEDIFRDGAESLAVCLLNAYKNPVHEQEIKKLFVADNRCVVISSDIIPHFREYERASTTVISAYIEPILKRYLSELERTLKAKLFKGSLLVMQANGGVLPVTKSMGYAVGTVVSGPAGGVIGASSIANGDNIISFDMGGTSTDVCLIAKGTPEISRHSMVSGFPIIIPMFHIETVGAGGGSIAWCDQGGMLRVGPQSAGSSPGPAAYGFGGNEATVTDALVVLGLLREDRLYSSVRLDKEAALNVVSTIGQRVGLDPISAAEAIVKIANARMGQTVRIVTVEQGYDPRDFSIVAFGGLGPTHACSVAEDLEIRRVVVPPIPGVFSAFGLLCTDFKRYYVQTEVERSSDVKWTDLVRRFEQMMEAGLKEMVYLKNDPLVKFLYQVDMRYIGQAYEVTVDVPNIREENDVAKLVSDFHKLHSQRYGFADWDEETEIVNYRLTLIHVREKPVASEFRYHGRPTDKKDQPFLTRDIHFNRMVHPCAFIHRGSLQPGPVLKGPIVIEEDTATTFVPPSWNLELDRSGNLVLTHPI